MTTLAPARPRTDAEEIYRENPPGPDWAERLTRALQAEYGVDPEWLGPYEASLVNNYGERQFWSVKR